ncbi:MAG: methyl-accepting chemotaxis protein [Cytophagales bacterium]|nr:methyl-accepting chemotaxis protein [Cytophagales bacterium]
MKFSVIRNFNIGKKLATGYVIVILLASVSGFYGVIVLRQSRVMDTKLYLPLLKTLERFENIVSSSRKLSNSWIYFPNITDKSELKRIHEEEYPQLVKELDDFENMEVVISGLDSLSYLREQLSESMSYQKQLMETLQSAGDYDDNMKIFDVLPIYDDHILPISEELTLELDVIIKKLQVSSEKLVADKYASFDSLENVMIILTVLAIVIGFIASYLSTSAIVNPIKKLNTIIQGLGKGELPDLNVTKTKDEIGDMIGSIENLIKALRNTSDFATEIGKGNLKSDYKKLSKNDTLGQALLDMRGNLNNVITETKDVVQDASQDGNFDTRINTENKEGAWKELGEYVNGLLLSIAMPLMSFNEIVNAMAEGDLKPRYSEEANGEILVLGDNLNKALDNLNSLLNQISDNANVVDESSAEMKVAGEEMNLSTGEIASAIAQMSNGAQTQVSKVDESSTLIENILQSAKKMGERAKTINEGVVDVVSNSNNGERMLDNVVSNMTEISTYSGKTNDSIKVLTERSQEISKVLGAISDIASQTNLLALNAAIEAAQAGDAGRGFAVVAEEIRKLAEDSKNSAREIETLIEGVQTDTHHAASAMETMSASVKIGEENSRVAAEMFKIIAEKSRTNLALSEDVLSGAVTQEKDIGEVVSNTENIVVIAEQTAAGTEEAASSATELSSGMTNYRDKANELAEIALELKERLGKFKLSESAYNSKNAPKTSSVKEEIADLIRA